MQSSLIDNTTVFISDRLNPDMKDFFQKILSRLRNELQLLADEWYAYENGTNDIFALIERSYVGIFNNALIRCFPRDVVLQEYSVKLDENKYGRGDYLVKHLHTETPFAILFEAKQRQFDGRTYSPEDLKTYQKEFINQGKKYYEKEKQYYTLTTYVSSLVFEWVRYKEHLEKLLKADIQKDDGITDFYCLYHTKTAGLMVYGNLERVRE